MGLNSEVWNVEDRRAFACIGSLEAEIGLLIDHLQKGNIYMTDKDKNSNDLKKVPNASPVGMLGDGTEEQNLNQPGNPAARITEDEVDAAFGTKKK